MKRFAFPFAAILLLLTAPAALARADEYVTVICDGVEYESVDIHAVTLGHKDDKAVVNFTTNTPLGLDCHIP